MADDAEDYDDDDLNDDEESEGPEVGVTIEIVGLSLYTHHGVSAAEREIGQRLVLDVRFDVGEPDALVTDRVEDTVDYGEVCQVIALIAQQRSYKTLERLCAVIADRLASQFNADSVTVKASKPEPPIPLPVEEVSVEVWREERRGEAPVSPDTDVRRPHQNAVRTTRGALLSRFRGSTPGPA